MSPSQPRSVPNWEPELEPHCRYSGRQQADREIAVVTAPRRRAPTQDFRGRAKPIALLSLQKTAKTARGERGLGTAKPRPLCGVSHSACRDSHPPRCARHPLPQYGRGGTITLAMVGKGMLPRRLHAIDAEGPATGDLMADSQGRRQRRQTRDRVVRSRPFDHGPHLVTLEPPHLGEFFRIDRDLLG